MSHHRPLPPAVYIPFLIPLLALLSAFPPLSTDMYLPIIPYLGELWGEGLETINLTLIVFFLGYSLALLVYGPLSDRFGRKQPLLAGLALFILGSFSCALAGSVEILIYARIFQGIGAAAPSVLGLSITKDHYTGPERQRVLALIGIIIALAPMVGPTVGSWILLLGSWHLIFILQAGVATIAFIGVFLLPETNKSPRYIAFTQMVRPYGSLCRNQRFFSLSLLFAASMCPFFAFIAASAEIYITGFGLSEQAFGLFFGLNALFLMVGSFICMKLGGKITDITMIRAGFLGLMVGGLLLACLPQSQILFFTLPMCFISLCFGLTRPFCMNLVLETVDKDTGSASSFMMFFNFIFGALAMWAIALGGDFKIQMIGVMAVASGGLTLVVLWFLYQGSGLRTKAGAENA